MSDSATPTPAAPAPAAAPQAPATQPAPPPAGQPPAQPTPVAPAAPAAPEAAKEPTNVREAKQALRRGPDRFPSTITEAKAALSKGEHHAQTQPRAEDGKFAATEASAAQAPDPNAPAAPAPDATPPAEGAAPAPSGEPAAPDAAATDAVPEGMVRIDIPEGHPMRHRGDHYLVPKGHEEYHRWAVNNTIRHQDVEGYAKSAKDWQQYANRLKAELDATREFAGGIFADPTVIAQIDDIRRTYGDEAAKRFEAGLWQEQQAKVAERTKAQEAESAKAEMDAYANDFMQRAWGEAEKRFPGMTPQEIHTAIVAYGSYVMARKGEELKMDEFLKHAAYAAIQNPTVRAEAERRRNARLEQERQTAAKAEADRLAAEERKKLEEAAARRSQYPWMGVPATAVPAQVGVDEGAGGPRTVHEARRSLSRRGRATAGA